MERKISDLSFSVAARTLAAVLRVFIYIYIYIRIFEKVGSRGKLIIYNTERRTDLGRRSSAGWNKCQLFPARNITWDSSRSSPGVPGSSLRFDELVCSPSC